MHNPSEVGGQCISNLQAKCDELVSGKLPFGQGLDAGVEFDFFASNSRKIVFVTSFHHMDEHGYYDGWTDYKVVITPTFGDFRIDIAGKDRNQIKDYLHDTFRDYFEL